MALDRHITSTLAEYLTAHNAKDAFPVQPRPKVLNGVKRA